MAFVNERVPDADKGRPVFNGYRWPAYLDPIRPYKWTFDRERDVFLISNSTGAPDFPEREYFVMGWKGELLPMELEKATTGEEAKGTYDYRWSVRRLHIPQQLENDRGEIIRTLKEALAVYGSLYRREHIRAVTFNF